MQNSDDTDIITDIGLVRSHDEEDQKKSFHKKRHVDVSQDEFIAVNAIKRKL